MIKQNTKPNHETTVFVAMSGGVDSSVVAGLVKDAGYKTVGVTMCFNITHPGNTKPSCCGIEGIGDAKRAAEILGIPHYVFNFAGDINDFIIEDFTREYLSGRTPNPCVRCNQHLKFGTLYDKVKALGADYIATGHYGKIDFKGDGRFELKKAADERKDQSYFLYSMKKETLPSVLFPLGGLTKTEVRDLARKYNLNTAEKPESQDICFVPQEGYKKFLEDRVGKETMIPGDFVDEEGKVVGQHKGIAYYTIGQRDKLGIALGYPVYVYRIDATTNTVHVGNLEKLYSKGLIAGQTNWVSMEIPKETIEVMARIRYNSPEVKAYLTALDEKHVRVEFETPQKSVTPGQSAVFYKDDIVLGGAIIDEPI
jgi:tRNA-specific 2-thiouridylase